MRPKKYALLFYFLVAAVLLQLFFMTFKNIFWFTIHLPTINAVSVLFSSPNKFKIQINATSVQHEQAIPISTQPTTKVDNPAAKNHFHANRKVPFTTEFSTTVDVETERTKHAVKNQSTFTSKQRTERTKHAIKNQSTFTSKQPTERAKSQSNHVLQNQLPVKRTSITVLSTKPIPHLTTTSLVFPPFISSHAIKNQATEDSRAQEPAKFTSEQPTERVKSQSNHVLQNQLPVKRTSITVLSTKPIPHLTTTSLVFPPFISSHAIKNQATEDSRAQEPAKFTSEQPTERVKSQSNHVLQNQLPVKRTSITVLSTKPIPRLTTTSLVFPPFISSHAIKNQATEDSRAQEPAKFTSEQPTERLNDQVTKHRFLPDSKMLFISEFSKAVEVKTVDVLLIILTYHKNFLRRKNIRRTWLTACRKHEKIDCWFFTDSLEAITDAKIRRRILKEQEKHKDIIFTPVGNGIKFGLRFLHLLMWGKANYDFNYIIRADDDIMVCIDHLMWDLPNFPSTNFHYGWMHCNRPNIVYIDEGFSMYSNDLVERYLSQKGDRILCHPFGDQQVAVWEHSLGIKGPDVYRPDNDRIHHNPPASYDNGMKTALNICDNFIAIHGVYRNDAIDFWRRRGEGHFNKYPAKKPSSFCRHYPNFNITIVEDFYNYSPKACSSNSSWTLDNRRQFNGRERG